MAFRHGAITVALEAVCFEAVRRVGRRVPWLGPNRPKRNRKVSVEWESLLSSRHVTHFFFGPLFSWGWVFRPAQPRRHGNKYSNKKCAETGRHHECLPRPGSEQQATSAQRKKRRRAIPPVIGGSPTKRPMTRPEIVPALRCGRHQTI